MQRRYIMETILNNNEQVYYVVRVNGAPITQPVASLQLAEMEKMKLPNEQQQLAEVVPVNASGQQMLFG